MTDTLSLFFAFLAIGGVLFTASVLTAAATKHRAAMLETVRPFAGWLAFAVAATATAGSLYYSEIAGFEPCELCWVQRIFMYPSAVILALALLLPSERLGWLATGLSAFGLPVSIYHRLEQQFPDSVSSSCSLDNPCSGRWVDEFGFITIPTMAGVAFILILLLTTIWLTGDASATAESRTTSSGTTSSKARNTP